MQLNKIGALFFLGLAGILVSVSFYKAFFTQPSTDVNVDLQFTAIIISAIALMLSISLPMMFNYIQLSYRLDESKISEKKEQCKNIMESINLFYLPLSGLLTIPDSDATSQARVSKVAEINCNKHLAEPSVRASFERYMEGKKEPKLLELVNGDIENLQKQYLELKKELKGR